MGKVLGVASSTTECRGSIVLPANKRRPSIYSHRGQLSCVRPGNRLFVQHVPQAWLNGSSGSARRSEHFFCLRKTGIDQTIPGGRCCQAIHLGEMSRNDKIKNSIIVT